MMMMIIIVVVIIMIIVSCCCTWRYPRRKLYQSSPKDLFQLSDFHTHHFSNLADAGSSFGAFEKPIWKVGLEISWPS